MRKAVFISYSIADSNLMEMLKSKIEKSELLYPIVITEQEYDENIKLLSDKIINGLDKADIIIPILTKKSRKNQWVNQELGYAKYKERSNSLIIPMVASHMFKKNRLKGFIHKEMDLPYNFSNIKKFKDVCKSLIDKIEEEMKIDKLIQFSNSIKRYKKVGDTLHVFEDKKTRELFGYSETDVIKLDESSSINYVLGIKIPSIKKIRLYKCDGNYYAVFNKEIKMIPDNSTLEYIQLHNHSQIVEVKELPNDVEIGNPLTTYIKLMKH